MLVFKCVKCKKKLWRYEKIGKGDIVRVHKERINRFFQDFHLEELPIDARILCECGNSVGNNKGTFISMAKNSYMTTGSKDNKRMMKGYQYLRRDRPE
ncbi:hypothetical protein CI610_01940 [invertebrate metagenome]|uniref:Uncharacterized protein n=1 Tax=invertebrate metagenome TaxID=1711999 RepID=A0A2H9T7A6_9ZZZZ